jgi:hypothetical protein
VWDNEGIYTSNELSKEYTKFGNGEESIIISRQHFDYGNENFELNITEYVNDVLNGKKINHGLCLAFSPKFETMDSNKVKYVGFFSNKTNTFFEPYLETIYNETISDDRGNFYLNKPNRLYFYATINGEPQNLDEMPICSIDDEVYEVKQATKGVYYAEITLFSTSVGPNTILYDKWRNLALNGVKMDDV